MKTSFLILALALTASVAVSSAAAMSSAHAHHAQDNRFFTHQEAGVTFELPKGWKAEPDGEVITVSTPDDSLQMVFWVPDEANFDAAVKELDKELGKTIKNIKMSGAGKKDTHNGMPHFGQSGTGEVEGTTIEWSVDVLGAKKPVIILTFAAPGVWEQHAESAAKFIASIKKTQ
ncbi:MAG TPA: hypothetical protein VIU65_10415 [Pyrinomonadaceae bacterium]